MTRLECRSELVVRARAGQISSAERAALDAHLVVCVSCRVSEQLGRDFEAEATLEPDDGKRIAAFATAARAWAGETSERVSSVNARPRRRRPAAFILAAAAVFVAVGASAAMGVFVSNQETAPPKESALQPLEATAQEQPEPQVVAPSVQTRDEAAPVTPEKPARAVADTSDSARALFQKANEARRLGDGTRALSLYRKLIGRFPASAEASLSQVRLGGMLLDQGQSRAALGHFDRYLALQPGGALSPEALYGRGRALSSLGRSSEEARAWTKLLSDFPKSPYAAHARKRLDALAGETKTGP
jgi:TolA-binding protein